MQSNRFSLQQPRFNQEHRQPPPIDGFPMQRYSQPGPNFSASVPQGTNFVRLQNHGQRFETSHFRASNHQRNLENNRGDVNYNQNLNKQADFREPTTSSKSHSSGSRNSNFDFGQRNYSPVASAPQYTSNQKGNPLPIQPMFQGPSSQRKPMNESLNFKNTTMPHPTQNQFSNSVNSQMQSPVTPVDNVARNLEHPVRNNLQLRVNFNSRGELKNLNNENCSFSDHGANAGTRLPIQPAHNFPQCPDIVTNFNARQQNRFISPVQQDSNHFPEPRKPLSSMPQVPLPPRNNQMPRPIQEFQNRLPPPNELSQIGIRIFENGVPRPTLANQSRSQLIPDYNQMLPTAKIPNHGGQRLPMQSPSMLFPKPFVHSQPQAILSSQNSSVNPHYKDSVKELVENWLKSKIFEVKEEEKQFELLKLHEYKKQLCKYVDLIEELRTLNDRLAECLEVESHDWNELLKNVHSVKGILESLKLQLFNAKQVEYIQKLLTKRKKKRARIRLIKHRRTTEYVATLTKRIKLNEEIDEWQHKEQVKITEKKMIDNLKTEAGESLQEVKRKQSQAIKFINTITLLKQLRDVRKGTAIYKGILVTSKDTERFDEKVSGITTLLSKQVDIYQDEEKALRVLREEEAEELDRVEREKRKKRKQTRQSDMHKVDPMFPFRIYWLQAEDNIQSLVHIRALWDLYLRPLNQPGSSRIPKGWVKPSQPSSREWRKYLVVSANRKRKGDNLNSVLNIEKVKQPIQQVS